MSAVKDITGERFGMWTAIQPVNRISASGKKFWLCKCDCGTVREVEGKSLRTGISKGCGCTRYEHAAIASRLANTKHGMRNTRLYVIWQAMKGRTQYPTTHSYEYYGGKGVTICDEWKNDFQSFADWALSHGYNDTLTIDRINPNGNYEPSNCRWATWSEQARNKTGRG